MRRVTDRRVSSIFSCLFIGSVHLISTTWSRLVFKYFYNIGWMRQMFSVSAWIAWKEVLIVPCTTLKEELWCAMQTGLIFAYKSFRRYEKSNQIFCWQGQRSPRHMIPDLYPLHLILSQAIRMSHDARTFWSPSHVIPGPCSILFVRFLTPSPKYCYFKIQLISEYNLYRFLGRQWQGYVYSE